MNFIFIIIISGHGYIEGLKNSHCIVNVKNKDNKCFLYSILAVVKYEEITRNKDRPQLYEPFLTQFKYNEEWFPMSLNNIPKFENSNPLYGINVFIYKKWDLKKTGPIFKNPNVDLVYKSNNSTNNQIYLLLINKGDYIIIN